MRRIIFVGLALVFTACPPPTPTVLEFSARALTLQVGEQREVRVRTVDGPVTNATFSSSDEGVVEVSVGANGAAFLLGRGIGQARITAHAGGLQAELPVTVNAATVTLTSLELSPPMPMVAKGTQLQLTATGLSSDGSRGDLTSQVTWSSSDVTVATVDATGLVSGLTEGTTTMTALLRGVRAQVTLTVSGASATRLEVSPSSLSLAQGTSSALRAIATLSDAPTADFTAQVTWASSDLTVATIDAAGLVRAVGVGAVTLTASTGTLSSTCRLTVTDAVLTALAVNAVAPLPRGSRCSSSRRAPSLMAARKTFRPRPVGRALSSRSRRSRAQGSSPG